MNSLQVVDEGFSQVPLIDISALVCGKGDRLQVASEIGQACRECGFFYIVGHGVDEGLQQRLEQLSRQFFAQDLATKMAIRMALGGKAWRGYFPVGGELTSGKPDIKEGIYFGAELGNNHPLVQANTPMHGANLFPENIPLFRETVLEYMEAMTQLGHILMAGIALSLGLEAAYFAERYTSDLLTLFRIFNYPPDLSPADGENRWGVGEHTDYGVLTILKQDDSGGLQVKSRSRWVAAPPIPGSFVCNIGDMLDRMTRGLYRSTPHRVQNLSGRDRLSFPFFFDPNFDVEVKPIPLDGVIAKDDRAERWDQSSVHDFQGTYGDYVLSKVSKVFPELRRTVLEITQ
ncbi:MULTISPECIES: isopenicillin N synthase family dioxygenase [unclassified Tolypothrix]|uniref:isopenicillin N synthase family dioxygenase n=1 Tax=unclassified Tolypothrix TaxID=2649714 RepID=UPI0005EAA5B2|nr:MULTISPECIES: 2-oxoglutarate and iron-dependent oxygenase domain-containing protein [unclassified Tolypothrix]BAY89611.1 2OG-Fe(II) oxygenase [Microchaete diplosiphon NIES-3275]EKF02595.1 oxidoreductase, 2OG-Fe(II) oxygenase family protein [Tolypothrix sp. PCC 7601]MBE9084769.1 isopenicillin N synthase family oxygenase [Tolypothrix sp. LEGE 11397]UYD23882.1 isopenicillin N synthase family oxygenase [Tolypothrix sp. PCC 7712]UYD33893.1 isopenicillin N synthase family oxygenase [Tolypothrix s